MIRPVGKHTAFLTLRINVMQWSSQTQMFSRENLYCVFQVFKFRIKLRWTEISPHLLNEVNNDSDLMKRLTISN